MKHIVISLVALFCTCSSCFAMYTAEVDSATLAAIDRINKIKLDTENYLYAEVTLDDWMQAYDSAKLLLKEKIEQWLTEQNKEDIVSFVAKSDEKFLEIKATRGNKYRAFVYVKKEDILTYSESRQIISSDVETENKKETQTPATESKKDKVTEVKPDVPKAKPQMTETKPTEAKPASSIVEAASEKNADPMAAAMIKIQKHADIQAFVMDAKSKGQVTEYGKYATRPLVGKYYMFIYNREGGIPARLMSADGKITNLDTGKPDNMDNYKNCGAIWFK